MFPFHLFAATGDVVARLESGQRRIDVVEFLELAEAVGIDPARTISALKKVS